MNDLLTELSERISNANGTYQNKFSNLYEEQFKLLINAFCSDKELFNFFHLNYTQALNEARSNNLNSANSIIYRTKKLINYDLLNDNEKKIFNLVSCPIDAYIHYKEENFEKAKCLTIETIKQDDYFQKINPALFYHKIQQLHNLCRILFKTKKYYELSILSNKLFKILIFNQCVNYENCTFFCDEKVNKFCGIKRMMTLQIFYEWIDQLDIISYLDREKFFNESTLDFEKLLDFSDNNLNDIILWINIRRELFNNVIPINQIKEFLTYSEDYTNPSPFNSLKTLLQ